MTADQCLEHPWLKQYPQTIQVIEAPIQHECETKDSIKAPLIEVEVCYSAMAIVFVECIQRFYPCVHTKPFIYSTSQLLVIIRSVVLFISMI